MVARIDDDRMRELYRDNFQSIRTRDSDDAGQIRRRRGRGSLRRTLTYFWDPEEDFPTWDDFLWERLIQTGTERFKITLSHSFILNNRETDELSFFHASQNNHAALERPFTVRDVQSFKQFLKIIRNTAILDQLNLEKPS